MPSPLREPQGGTDRQSPRRRYQRPPLPHADRFIHLPGRRFLRRLRLCTRVSIFGFASSAHADIRTEVLVHIGYTAPAACTGETSPSPHTSRRASLNSTSLRTRGEAVGPLKLSNGKIRSLAIDELAEAAR